MSAPSKACCTTAPTDTQAYEPKGVFSEIGGLNTYTVGRPNAKIAILSIYDIFGLTPPTLRGADLLTSLPPQPLVLIPDFFKGAPMLQSNYPPDTPEKQALIQDFFKGPANPTETVGVVAEYLKAARERYPEIEQWVLAGFCWGGKIAALVSREGTVPEGVVGSVQVHPAFLDRGDAEAIKIPHLLLASKDEDAKVVEEYKTVFDGVKESEVHTYVNMHHGWMGARAKLEDVEHKEEYNRGYKQIAEWVNAHFAK